MQEHDATPHAQRNNSTAMLLNARFGYVLSRYADISTPHSRERNDVVLDSSAMLRGLDAYLHEFNL